jgi:nitrile hydratase accessory protein
LNPAPDRYAERPDFAEPWQAQSFAMAQVLIETGKVSSTAWAETLGAALKRRHNAGAPDTTETYYEAVAEALGRVLCLNQAEVANTMAAWRAAYEATPHGQPVRLGRGRSRRTGLRGAHPGDRTSPST